jgi:cation diffusion facilitator family transporter
MDAAKQKTAAKEIKSVTLLAVATNIFLFIIKLLVGLFTGSMAIIADAIHSLSDMVTDLAVLLGVRLGAKEPDQSHPYGHGRAETFSAGFIAVVLLLVGAALVYYAAIDIAKGKVTDFSTAVLTAATVSVVAKEWLYRITKRIAIRHYSTALYANAWHHRSDAFSSVAVVIGFVAIKLGFKYGDQIAAIAVGLMIALVSAKVLGDCLRELTEGAVDQDTVGHIKNIINADASIHHWHKLRTRMVGREIFLDLHILVDPALNIAAAHQIAEKLEDALHTQLTRPVNITVHIEPDTPELRK